jgi:hypothetical protein
MIDISEIKKIINDKNEINEHDLKIIEDIG